MSRFFNDFLNNYYFFLKASFCFIYWLSNNFNKFAFFIRIIASTIFLRDWANFYIRVLIHFWMVCLILQFKSIDCFFNLFYSRLLILVLDFDKRINNGTFSWYIVETSLVRKNICSFSSLNSICTTVNVFLQEFGLFIHTINNIVDTLDSPNTTRKV